MLQIKSRPPKCIGCDIFVKQHNPYTSQASFAKGIDPINSHTSYFEKSIGLNKITVPINRTVSSKWNQRVFGWLTNMSRMLWVSRIFFSFRVLHWLWYLLNLVERKIYQWACECWESWEFEVSYASLYQIRTNRYKWFVNTLLWIQISEDLSILFWCFKGGSIDQWGFFYLIDDDV